MTRPGSGNMGFTLVELIVTMVISMIVAGVIAQLVSRPMEAYASSSHRANLTDAAGAALAQFTNDLRGALPNSIRIACSGSCLEFLDTIDGGRFRSVAPGDRLDFNPASADTSFDVLGPALDPAPITTGSNPDDCENGIASCLVVYNTGLAGSDAYQRDNIATITALVSPFTSISFDNSYFSSGDTAFPMMSPQQRFHIVGGPVSYICDAGTGTLRRYDNYPITALHSSIDSHAEIVAISGSETAIVTDKLSACQFVYDPGTATRGGLVKFSLTLTENMYSGHSESITLLKQAHVNNAP